MAAMKTYLFDICEMVEKLADHYSLEDGLYNDGGLHPAFLEIPDGCDDDWYSCIYFNALANGDRDEEFIFNFFDGLRYSDVVKEMNSRGWELGWMCEFFKSCSRYHVSLC